MLATVLSSTLVGVDAVPVTVEVDVACSLPGYHVVGLPAQSVKEGGVRVSAALAAAGFDLPLAKVTVNLAPADLRKPGCAFDLPILIGVLGAERKVSIDRLAGLVLLGEVGLDGSLRAVRGTLATAMLARERGWRGVLVPRANAHEAAVVTGVEVYCAGHVLEVIEALRDEAPLPTPAGVPPRRPPLEACDLADVRGQLKARAALEVAVAGGHNLLFSGPPGNGKSLLAKCIPGVLPELTHEEILETTKIYSAAGLADVGLVEERPYRAPHHTISTAGLLGGGTIPKPGEISLAHNGVLFLDELPEFSRSAVESLRQPLEDRSITVTRVSGTVRLPASFLLAASANPCPCGWLDSGMKECTCSILSIERYRARMSGPLLDRIDLQIFVRPPPLVELRREAPSESSAAVRGRVSAARGRQRRRLASWGVRSNAEMSLPALRATCKLGGKAEAALASLCKTNRALSARSLDRILRVARTIADLTELDAIDEGCILEAASYRALDAGN